MRNKSIYYKQYTNEILGKLSRDNMISTHVKRSPLLWLHNRCGYTTALPQGSPWVNSLCWVHSGFNRFHACGYTLINCPRGTVPSVFRRAEESGRRFHYWKIGHTQKVANPWARASYPRVKWQV